MLKLAMHCAMAALSTAARPPDVIMTVLVDDLGFADLKSPHGGEFSPTPHLSELSAEGVNLANMHAYWFCSPSRRSLLSGRFPVHISGNQAPDCSNYLPLQLTLLSEKLKQANYSTHFIGKGHLGYQTTDHLPLNRGFDTHVGYLAGGENYEHGLQVMCDIPQLAGQPAATWHGAWPPPSPPHPCHLDMWQGNATASAVFVDSLHYSTTTFAAETVARIEAKQSSTPLFIYLAWQAVHGAWVLPDVPAAHLLQPSDPAYDNYCSRQPLPLPGPTPHADALARTQHMRCQFGSMLKVLDLAMANITAALKAQGLWESTLMFVMSDNGGVGPGNNFPLRGQKATPWQGATRVAAFVTGGVVPARLHGRNFSSTVHFADVYPTLCGLVGVNASDTVVVQGRPRPIDGLDFWPALLNSSSSSSSSSGNTPALRAPLLREYLPTTAVSIIWNGRWKLITAATRAGAYWCPAGGKGPNNTVVSASVQDWPCVDNTTAGNCVICSAAKPCLFDLDSDEAERANLAEGHPHLVEQLAKQLRSYMPYVNGSMGEEELQKYECAEWKGKFPHPFWGNYTGPCCRPK